MEKQAYYIGLALRMYVFMHTHTLLSTVQLKYRDSQTTFKQSHSDAKEVHLQHVLVHSSTPDRGTPPTLF